VDDGCPEDSGRKAAELWRSESLPETLELRVLRLAARAGQQAAVFCGLEASRGEWVITMDDDTQHPPAFIRDLLSLRKEGADLIYALPVGPRSPGSLGRDRLFRWILGLPGGIGLGSFRLIRGTILEGIRGKGRGFVYVSALLLRENRKLEIRNVFYPSSGREVSESLPSGSASASVRSRIPLSARLALSLKIVLKYGLLRGRALPGAGPAYRIGEEL
jgi:undecaprenyl-phosphate 4-deoxy-4-formamido-L-arabinose transferase